MSGSDGTESQCDRISEATKVAMGDVLTKEQNNDAKKNETTDSDDECAHKNLRQEADGAPDVLEVGPEPVLPQRFRLDTENTVHRGVSSKESLSKKDLKTIESLPQKHERNCLCEACKSQRVILKEKVECVWRWQSQGLKLRKYIQSVFDAAIESLIVPNATKYQCDPEKYAELKEIVEDLSKEHPHILFLMLVVQAQEFVVELKIRIIDPVQDTNFVRIAEIFLTRLLNGYDRLISTAVQVSELIKPLEDRHLNKFNLTWEFFNKKLYQNYIYFYEPTIRNILPIVVCYLRKPREGQGYQVLLERYLAFVDEMMQIAGLWSEKELLIDKYNVEQVALIVKNRKINAKDWKIRTNDEIMKLDSDREMDVPGFGIRGIPKRLFKKSATVPNTNSLDTEFVRKVLDTWGESMYHSMAQNFMGLHMSFVDDVISEIFHNAGKGGPVDDDPEYYFGYQKAAWLVLSRPDKFTDAETQCSICREASWVSNLVVGGRTKEGTCAHPVLQQNSTKLAARSREDEEKNSNSSEQRKECLCIRQHLGEWQVRLLRGWLPFPPCLCALELRRQPDELCPCMQNRREQLARIKSSTKPVSSSSSSSIDSTIVTAEKKKVKNVVKKANIPEVNSTQTQTRHSTTQTPNSGHSHGHNGHQGRCPTHGQNHGTPPEGKNTPNSNFHRPHNHNSHSCNKQTSVESIKKLAANELSQQTDGDCSDSGSSHEDSCSTSSSTARDTSRHCDCCYCEVFGHGVPPVAPVSRNYNEMKERLRQLLTKKKALSKCKGLANCSPPMSPAESVLSSNTNSRERSNTPLSTVSINQTDQRDLDTLVNFIEGKSESENKKDNSKSEKKARQKQKKLDEALKKEKDEQERQKLVEFRKKTPEVTITVVDPQKPASKKHLMNRNLPEVSILPAVQPTPKQLTVKKELENKQTDPKSKKNETKLIRNNTEDIQKSKKMAKKVSEKNEVKKEGKKTKKVIPEPEPVPEPVPEPEVPLTKRERKELRREMRRKEEEKAKENVGQDQPQIVTIKRVMESSSAEPTVTITLKGHTPAEDKVLFTLINGQTKENSKDAPQTTGKKKKKNKGENIVNPPKKEVQQLSTKTQVIKNESKNTTKQQTGNDKQKNSGQKVDEKSGKMPVVEVKSTKSKKDKKNAENKQPEGQQIVQNVLKDKSNQQDVKGKKQNKIQPLVESKIQENVVNVNVPLSKKEKKAEKKHRQSLARAANELASKQNIKIENQKPEIKVNQNPCQNLKQKSESQKLGESNFSNFGGQLKETSSKINIENLKLPPGITITKVDGPSKPIPIKSTPLQKQPSPPKQATIIAAPMTGMQSNYGGSQSGGNVIVVDTGKLKQDLLPKNGEKGNLKLQQQQQQPTTTGKKKKKKKNNASNNGNNLSSQKSTDLSKTSKNTGNEDHANILHNPATNMVTIRNPAFSPAPKMEPAQQAAIIKVSENGMVTIRSPALQQAINAGLTPPPKPDFIVKGDLTTNTSSRTSTITSSTNTGNSPNQMKNSNGMMQSSLAELRSRLTPDCTGITGLARMQINKVANGQPIPENGINLMGTSVTLTKVKNPASLERIEDTSQAAMISSKGKKKKKNGSGTRQCGDDWNLVESVFTPKDIDLEDGEMDDAERELEAFKRFCLQSVPPPRKEKVKLNIKDIVLKKKSSSSSTAAAVITAN